MDRTGTQTDFDNVDINPLSPTFNLHTEETRNAPGKSKIKGIEAELTVHPAAGLTFGLSYAYTHVKVPPTANPFLNNVLYPVYVVYTPPHAASGSIDYEIPVGDMGARLKFHVDGNYSDAMYSFQSEPVKAESSFIVNGSIALADWRVSDMDSRATLSLWSRNLFNKSYIYRRSNANNGTLGDYANFNAPRTFGVELKINY
jgi:iron complex outermembrane receptor protein